MWIKRRGGRQPKIMKGWKYCQGGWRGVPLVRQITKLLMEPSTQSTQRHWCKTNGDKIQTTVEPRDLTQWPHSGMNAINADKTIRPLSCQDITKMYVHTILNMSFSFIIDLVRFVIYCVQKRRDCCLSMLILFIRKFKRTTNRKFYFKLFVEGRKQCQVNLGGFVKHLL